MSAPDGRASADCPAPLDEAILMDYWLALLPAQDEAPVDEHLLSCDGCGERLRRVIVFADGLRGLARSGSLRVVVSAPFVQRAVGAGLRVREYAVPPGGSVHCTVSADDEFLVAHLAADLTGAGRFDLSFCDRHGVELQRMSDIPVSPGAGGLVYQESMLFAKASPTMTLMARLLAVDAAGAERILGEYTFEHERTLAGPAGWQAP